MSKGEFDQTRNFYYSPEFLTFRRRLDCLDLGPEPYRSPESERHTDETKGDSTVVEYFWKGDPSTASVEGRRGSREGIEGLGYPFLLRRATKVVFRTPNETNRLHQCTRRDSTPAVVTDRPFISKLVSEVLGPGTRAGRVRSGVPGVSEVTPWSLSTHTSPVIPERTRS